MKLLFILFMDEAKWLSLAISMSTQIIENTSFRRDLILSDPPYDYPRKLEGNEYSEANAPVTSS